MNERAGGYFAYAARTFARNSSTLTRNMATCLLSSSAEANTCPAAAPLSAAARATIPMLPDASLVPCAASWMFRAISLVAEPCSSTAEAIAFAIPLMPLIVLSMSPIASTAFAVAVCMAATWAAMSSVALAVWLDRDLTSLATTANPRPASPARAASNVALQR